MMKQNIRFRGDGGLCIDLLITNSKFSFMKTNSFEIGLRDHHHLYYSSNKIWKVWTEEIDSDSDQFKLDICYSMSAMRTHAAFENNFVSIVKKHAPKKIKN